MAEDEPPGPLGLVLREPPPSARDRRPGAPRSPRSRRRRRPRRHRPGGAAGRPPARCGRGRPCSGRTRPPAARRRRPPAPGRSGHGGGRGSAGTTRPDTRPPFATPSPAPATRGTTRPSRRAARRAPPRPAPWIGSSARSEWKRRSTTRTTPWSTSVRASRRRRTLSARITAPNRVTAPSSVGRPPRSRTLSSPSQPSERSALHRLGGVSDLLGDLDDVAVAFQTCSWRCDPVPFSSIHSTRASCSEHPSSLAIGFSSRIRRLARVRAGTSAAGWRPDPSAGRRGRIAPPAICSRPAACGGTTPADARRRSGRAAA